MEGTQRTDSAGGAPDPFVPPRASAAFGVNKRHHASHAADTRRARSRPGCVSWIRSGPRASSFRRPFRAGEVDSAGDPGQTAQIYMREVVLPGVALRGRQAPDNVVLFVHGAGTPAEVSFDVPTRTTAGWRISRTRDSTCSRWT